MKLTQTIHVAENKINYVFNDKNLLSQALTHSSYANEHGLGNNERLEFLGDAVLELSISQEIYRRYPEASEGDMTRLRSSLVNEGCLASIARDIGLGSCLFLGKGEQIQGGGHRDSVLSDALEAILSAIFLDGGYNKAQQCILFLFQEKWPKDITRPPKKDYKSQLQEETQKLFKKRPVYTLVDSYGPEHDKIYKVQVALPEGEKFIAKSGNVKKAEQNSACNALQYLYTLQHKTRKQTK
ncbi:MAG: ribonuclease III [Thermodesulfobacteriota bacterium]